MLGLGFEQAGFSILNSGCFSPRRGYNALRSEWNSPRASHSNARRDWSARVEAIIPRKSYEACTVAAVTYAEDAVALMSTTAMYTVSVKAQKEAVVAYVRKYASVS